MNSINYIIYMIITSYFASFCAFSLGRNKQTWKCMKTLNDCDPRKHLVIDFILIKPRKQVVAFAHWWNHVSCLHFQYSYIDITLC